MKMKPNMRKYCPRCKSHTDHKVKLYKKGKNRNMAEGNRRMAKKTRGYGSFPKPIQKRFAKTTKKSMLQYECVDCGYTFQTKGMRLKKLEILRA